MTKKVQTTPEIRGALELYRTLSENMDKLLKPRWFFPINTDDRLKIVRAVAEAKHNLNEAVRKKYPDTLTASYSLDLNEIEFEVPDGTEVDWL